MLIRGIEEISDMSNINRLIINIEPTADDSDKEELEEVTHNLQYELNELDGINDIDFVKKDQQKLPEGAKAVDIAVWGSLLVTFVTSSGILPALINTLQSWLSRHERHKITMEIGGDKIELTGISNEERKKLIDAFVKRQSKG